MADKWPDKTGHELGSAKAIEGELGKPRPGIVEHFPSLEEWTLTRKRLTELEVHYRWLNESISSLIKRIRDLEGKT